MLIDDILVNGDPWHIQRFKVSYSWITNYLTTAKSYLDFGGPSVFTDLIKRLHPALKVEHSSNQDLRYPLTFQSNTFDLITCMEVIEHLADRTANDVGAISTFFGNGMQSMLAEAYRLLKPGGTLFLTTPNACGYYNLFRVLNMQHPFSYEYHTRELAPEDLRKLLADAQFQTTRWSIETIWNWQYHYSDKLVQMQEALNTMGFSADERGDCIFVIATKPVSNQT